MNLAGIDYNKFYKMCIFKQNRFPSCKKKKNVSEARAAGEWKGKE
jgi:hypothetical protein